MDCESPLAAGGKGVRAREGGGEIGAGADVLGGGAVWPVGLGGPGLGQQRAQVAGRQRAALLGLRDALDEHRSAGHYRRGAGGAAEQVRVLALRAGAALEIAVVARWRGCGRPGDPRGRYSTLLRYRRTTPPRRVRRASPRRLERRCRQARGRESPDARDTAGCVRGSFPTRTSSPSWARTVARRRVPRTRSARPAGHASAPAYGRSRGARRATARCASRGGRASAGRSARRRSRGPRSARPRVGRTAAR